MVDCDILQDGGAMNTKTQSSHKKSKTTGNAGSKCGKIKKYWIGYAFRTLDGK